MKIFKIGGYVLNAMESIMELISCISSKISKQSVIVHGGGDVINYWLKNLGITPSFINGQRVTDEKTISVVEMVLSGLINKRLVSALRSKGFKTVGISGRDGKLSIARIMDDGLGFVGHVRKVNPDIIYYLMEKGILPVLSPVSDDGMETVINVNADFFASAIAVSTGAEELNILTSTGGVVRDNKLIENISISEAVSLIEDKTVTQGMIPKLQSAVKTLKGGVGKVNLLNYRGEVGTTIR